MHILFVIPGLGFGGAERVVANLSNKMVKTNEVTIVLTSGGKEIAYNLDKRINLQKVPQGYGAIKIWTSFRKICKDIKPDVVLAFMADTGVMASVFLAGLHIPVIVSERNDPTQKSRKTSRAVKMLSKISTLLAKGYVFQSEGAKSFYPKRVQKKSCIILNPLNIDKLPQRELDKIDNRIVSVGRLHPQKNQKMLINAFANSNAKDTHTLHIYGDGILRDELSELITSLKMNDRIFLEGNSKQVHEDIKNAKLFVFTSDYEGLPNALMEAMVMGIPCISTDCSPGGARMLIKDKENGILIPCNNVDRLTAELDNVAKGSYDLESIGNNAKLLAEKTNIDKIADEWLESIHKFTGV